MDSKQLKAAKREQHKSICAARGADPRIGEIEREYKVIRGYLGFFLSFEIDLRKDTVDPVVTLTFESAMVKDGGRKEILTFKDNPVGRNADGDEWVQVMLPWTYCQQETCWYLDILVEDIGQGGRKLIAKQRWFTEPDEEKNEMERKTMEQKKLEQSK